MSLSYTEVLLDVTSQRGVEPSRCYKKNFVAYFCQGKHNWPKWPSCLPLTTITPPPCQRWIWVALWSAKQLINPGDIIKAKKKHHGLDAFFDW